MKKIKQLRLYTLIDISIYLPLAILSVNVLVYVIFDFSLGGLFSPIAFLSLLAFFLVIAMLIGLVTKNDFYKTWDGEILDENTTAFPNIKDSFWLLIVGSQIVWSFFSSSIENVVKMNISNMKEGYDRDKTEGILFLISFFLPILIFILRAFFSRPINNEKAILKIKRREKLLHYIESNELEKIDYFQWIKDDIIIQKDKALILKLVKKDSFTLLIIDESLKKDREIVLEAVKNDGFVLQYVDESYKKDKEVVIEAMKSSNGWAFKFADESLKNDPDIVSALVSSSSN